MTADEDMIADRRSTWSRSRTDRAQMVKSTVGANPGISMHPDRAAMRNNETRSDLGVGVNVDERDYNE